MAKRAYGAFWCAWSKFDRGKKMTKSAHIETTPSEAEAATAAAGV
jgi:hypothetical protein